MTHGELDFRVPVGQGLQVFTTLQRLGVPSRMVDLPDEGHGIGKPADAALRAGRQRCLASRAGRGSDATLEHPHEY